MEENDLTKTIRELKRTVRDMGNEMKLMSRTNRAMYNHITSIRQELETMKRLHKNTATDIRRIKKTSDRCARLATQSAQRNAVGTVQTVPCVSRLASKRRRRQRLTEERRLPVAKDAPELSSEEEDWERDWKKQVRSEQSCSSRTVLVQPNQPSKTCFPDLRSSSESDSKELRVRNWPNPGTDRLINFEYKDVIVIDMEFHRYKREDPVLLQLGWRSAKEQRLINVVPTRRVEKHHYVCCHMGFETIGHNPIRLYRYKKELSTVSLLTAINELIKTIKANPCQVIVAHNGDSCDFQVLRHVLEETGKTAEFNELNCKSVDSCNVLRSLWGHNVRHSVAVLAEKFAIPHDAHDALSDADVLYQALVHHQVIPFVSLRWNMKPLSFH